MADFRRLSETIYASPQITPTEVAQAAEAGFACIINNRPDEEEPGQPSGDAIASAAREHGLGYTAIPVGHAGFSEPQIEAMREALDNADGKVLAYCRSGTRSTFLWALARARQGDDPGELAALAAAAGYDLAPLAPMLDVMAAKARD